MRFSTLIVSSLLTALTVTAQNSTTLFTSSTAASTTTEPPVSGTQSATPAQQSAADCLKTCSPDDSECRAECNALASQVNPIADCQASCPKGNGTAEDNQNYNDCVTDCIATAQVTSVSSTATFAQSETSTPTEGADAETTGDQTPAGTTSAPIVTQTGGAVNVHLSMSVFAMLGLSALMMAL